MRIALQLLTLAGIAFTGVAHAQQQGKQPPLPPLLECGTHADADILCGTHSPEDLELTPDGKDIIVSQFARNSDAGFSLFDPAKKTFTKMTVTAEPLKDWGDAACPGPIGAAVAPHGISLLKRSNGKVQLFVVNHGGRESIEMFEVKHASGAWSLIWHGCVVSKQAFNDVATLPDGSFIATHPTALQTPGMDLFAGQPSGYVSRWSAAKGEVELPGTRAGYPNGVVASTDGRFMYFNAWTAREVHKYDLRESKETGMVKLDFMPDNLSWTKKGQMLAAGVKGARGDCPSGSGTPCIQTFGVAEIDPATMRSTTVFDSQGKGALISGVSIALQMGDAIYIGSFQGERLVKIGWKK
jgi:hypothetical protein